MIKVARLLLAAVSCLFLLASPLFPQSSQGEKQPPASSPSSSSSSSSSNPAWYNPSRYNPAKLFKRGAKSANDQLASNDELEAKLTGQLQAHGVLAKNANLQDVCSDFKTLVGCISTLRASRNVNIDFSCLKWDVTGIKPAPVADSCAGPSDGKAMSLQNSIDLLKPGVDAKGEAANAVRNAEHDIKDAS
jgi:hypothetical protein